MISVFKELPFRSRAAIFLCAAALAAGLATQASPSPGASEIPDEKGRTPSQIAEEQSRSQAIAERMKARKSQAAEERRRAVSVPSDAAECLAYHRSERRCLVTVGEFNLRLREDGQWVEGGGDSSLPSAQILEVRNRLLVALLEERFADALVAGQGKGGIQAEEAWRAHLAGMQAQVGEDRLCALYRKHAAAFGPRLEVEAEFIGASDSSFLDSLVGCMLDPPEKGCASGRQYLWGKLQAGDLPDHLPRITGKLRQGEISAITRGAYGWFVVAATRVMEIPPKSFAEARPLLAYMAGLPEAPAENGEGRGEGNGSPVVSGRAATDAESARVDDPVLNVWLLPRAASGKGKRTQPPAWSDTGLVDALLLRLSDMPADVRCEAAAHVRRSGRGFSTTRFGNWYYWAVEHPSLARSGKEEPCVHGIGTPRPPPGPLSLAEDYFASKEKDFKRNIMETRTQASGTEGSATGVRNSLCAQWIAENVTLANNVLKRF